MASHISSDHLVVGNAYTDGAPRGGWFVARFIDNSFGLRCRKGKGRGADAVGDFELKLRRHFSGDREEKQFPFNKTATTVSILMGDGHCVYYFCHGNNWQVVTLERDGDYVLWGPTVGHKWIVSKASSVLTVRCPGVDSQDQEETAGEAIPDELKRYFQECA